MEKNPLDDDLLRELGLDGDLDLSSGKEEVKSETTNEAFEDDPTTGFGSTENELGSDSFSKAPTDPGQSARFDDSDQTPAEPIITPPVQQEVKAQSTIPQGSAVEDMPVQLVGVLAKKTMNLREVLSLKQGEIIDMKKLPGEQIDLVANGKLVAKGQMVLVDGQIGIQIKQIIA